MLELAFPQNLVPMRFFSFLYSFLISFSSKVTRHPVVYGVVWRSSVVFVYERVPPEPVTERFYKGACDSEDVPCNP